MLNYLSPAWLVRTVLNDRNKAGAASRFSIAATAVARTHLMVQGWETKVIFLLFL